jgi:hypothetical protein
MQTDLNVIGETGDSDLASLNNTSSISIAGVCFDMKSDYREGGL